MACRWPLLAAVVAGALAAFALGLPSPAGAATGDLGYQGCVTGETQSGPGGSGACAQVPSAASFGANSGMQSLHAVAVSADGESVYTASQTDHAVASFDRVPATGALSYAGCITGETESGPGGSGACAEVPSASSGGNGSGLRSLTAVAVSADGESVYAASQNDDAVASFDRDPATGALSYVGCVTGETESGPGGSGACAEVPSASAGGDNSGMDSLEAVAVSADGESVYAASQNDAAVASFSRDPATGALSYAGCVTGETESGPGGSGACAEVPSASSFGVNSGMQRLRAVAVSADGESVYAASAHDDAVASFDRDPATGALSYAGCITGKTESGPGGSGACAEVPSPSAGGDNSGMQSVWAVAVSADGESVYAASAGDSAVASFSRDPATGALSYAGCVTGETESGPGGSGACAEVPSASSFGVNSGMQGVWAVAVSADGGSVYAASEGDSAVASFRRDPATGALSYAGCITGETESGPGGSGACAEVPSASSFGDDSGLRGLTAVAVSADGESVYTVSTGDDAVASFDREAPEPSLSVSDVSVQEGDVGQTQATFEVTLSDGGLDPVRVDANTEDASATAPSDYAPAGRTLVIPPGHGSASFDVAVNGDTAFEPDEAFLVRLTDAEGATIADSTGVGTIQNDDPVPDTDPPETNLTGGPTGTTNDESPTFTFTADEVASFECRLDSPLEHDFAPCTSPHTTPPLADGPHTLEVRAIDGAGNPDPTPAIARFTVATATCFGQVATIVGTAADERIAGTSGDDVIVSGGGDDIVTAGAGHDRVCSRGGEDQVNAGIGDDRILGGAGPDTLIGFEGADTVLGDDGDDSIQGGNGTDTLFGHSGDDNLQAGSGTDLARGNSGDDALTGGADADELLAHSGDDSIQGEGGADTLRSGSGDDFADGGGEADLVIGAGDDDALAGSDGDDELSGRSGDDTLDGGNGSDDCAGGSGENGLVRCE